MELRQNYDKIVALGFQVIAINPDTPENCCETIRKYNLPFKVLSDTKVQSAKDFGIAWEVNDRDEATYEKLRVASGESHRLLPAPAYFIFDTKGIIQFEHVNPNHRVRPPFSLMLVGAEIVKGIIETPDN